MFAWRSGFHGSPRSLRSEATGFHGSSRTSPKYRSLRRLLSFLKDPSLSHEDICRSFSFVFLDAYILPKLSISLARSNSEMFVLFWVEGFRSFFKAETRISVEAIYFLVVFPKIHEDLISQRFLRSWSLFTNFPGKDIHPKILISNLTAYFSKFSNISLLPKEIFPKLFPSYFNSDFLAKPEASRI